MIDPRGMTVTDWCDTVTHTLRQYGPIPVLLTAESWPRWAVEVLQIPQVFKYSPPDPRGFDSWQEWAFRFNQAVPY